MEVRGKGVVFSPQCLRSGRSSRTNIDREMVDKILREKRLSVDVPSILELCNKIGDNRLVAFICGVNIETVNSIMEGETIPEGLVFTVEYIAGIIGVEKQNLSSKVTKFFGGQNTTSSFLDREKALKLIGEYRSLIIDDEYIIEDVVEIFKTNIVTARRFMSKVGFPTGTRGYRTVYNKKVVDSVAALIARGGVSMVLIQMDLVSGKFIRIPKTLPKISLNIKKNSYLFLPSEWKDIVCSAFVVGMKVGQYRKEVSRLIQNRNKEIEIEILQIIGKTQKGKTNERKN